MKPGRLAAKHLLVRRGGLGIPGSGSLREESPGDAGSNPARAKTITIFYFRENVLSNLQSHVLWFSC